MKIKNQAQSVFPSPEIFLDHGQFSVEGLQGASRALFLSHLATGSPIFIITRDQITGESLLGDLQYFASQSKSTDAPRLFPTWELLPYEHLSPLKEISG